MQSMTPCDPFSHRSMWGLGCSSDSSQWRIRKRSSPTDDKDSSDLMAKRFASEELVTAHFRDLHISPPHRHNGTPSHRHTITPPHHHTITQPLVVTAVTDCPGLVNTSYVAESNYSDRYTNGLHSPDSSYQCGSDPELTRESSPLELIEDTSGGTWLRGEGTCPPVYPIRAQQDLNGSWESHDFSNSRLPGCSPALTNQITVEPEESMTVTEDQDDDVINMGDSPSEVGKSPCKSTCSSRPWVSWRPVAITDVNSDSSDSSGDEPERPLSMWIAPELVQCARSHCKALPQSLLDKYNTPMGMEVVVWVDPATRLTAGCEGFKTSEGEMQDMTEDREDRQVVDNDMN